jgi:Na+/H+ antiporter NhaD/arsenite permease-like protein
MAEREGHPITFGQFLKYAAPVTFGTIIVASAYLWLRYLL